MQCSHSKPKQNTAQSPVPNMSSSSLGSHSRCHVAKFNARELVWLMHREFVSWRYPL